MIKLKTYTHFDREGFGCNAFSVLVPEGWSVSGGLIWQNHPTMPSVLDFSIKSPDGLSELRFLPAKGYTWSDMPMFYFSFPEGSNYMGNEVRRPISSFENYIRHFILPNFGANIRITGSKRLPELIESVRAEASDSIMYNPFFDAGSVRIEYDYYGKTYEVDIICAVMVVNVYSSVMWYADKMFLLRAEKGKLDENYKMFEVMIKSFKLDINWYNKRQQMINLMVQNQLNASAHAMIRSRIISNANNQISDMIMRSYERQQASYDRVFSGISQSIRGVTSYYDPHKGYSVELPNTYRYAYGNALGEYILTDDPFYNPNQHSNLNWEPLNRT